MTYRLIATLGFILGIIWGHLDLEGAVLGVGFLGALALIAQKLCGRSRWIFIAFMLGFLRVGIDADPPVRQIAPGERISVQGLVLDNPRSSGAGYRFLFQVLVVGDEVLSKPFIIFVDRANPEDLVEIAERWEFTGRWGRGRPSLYPGGFDEQWWLWTQRAQGVLKVGRFDGVAYLGPPAGLSGAALASRLREAMIQRLKVLAHPLERGLVVGVVFGDAGALPLDIQKQFRKTGTTHLLAASGMNVALLLGLITWVTTHWGLAPWRVAPLLMAVAISYAFLAGCSPSINRAAVSSCCVLLAALWGRSSSPWNSVCLSLWILLLWEPRQLYDVGFQLSVMAVIGLLAGPKLPKEAPAWKTAILMTLSASLATFPILWTTFHELSLTLLPANLILGPLVELLFPLGLLLSIVPWVGIAKVVGFIAWSSLYLVARLASLADPLALGHPRTGPFILFVFALGLWWVLGGPGPGGLAELKKNDRKLSARGGAKEWGYGFSLGLALLSLAWSQAQGKAPQVALEELRICRVGEDLPYYWISTHDEERIVLSEAWQEPRAKAMLLRFGCTRVAKVELKEKFDLAWGHFRWSNIAPFLGDATFTEVRTAGCDYSVSQWRPKNGR